MAYATYLDVQARMSREMTESEQELCTILLDDAAVIIDSFNEGAAANVKLIVSCRMVIRALGDNNDAIPVGATQGSMSGLGYSQSWTMSSNGSVGELYLSKTEKALLGGGNKIGSHSPIEDMTEAQDERDNGTISG